MVSALISYYGEHFLDIQGLEWVCVWRDAPLEFGGRYSHDSSYGFYSYASRYAYNLCSALRVTYKKI
jgi:hypothetical protein